MMTTAKFKMICNHNPLFRPKRLPKKRFESRQTSKRLKRMKNLTLVEITSNTKGGWQDNKSYLSMTASSKTTVRMRTAWICIRSKWLAINQLKTFLLKKSLSWQISSKKCFKAMLISLIEKSKIMLSSKSWISRLLHRMLQVL